MENPETVDRTRHTVHWELLTGFWRLDTVDWILSTGYCSLETAYCSLETHICELQKLHIPPVLPPNLKERIGNLP